MRGPLTKILLVVPDEAKAAVLDTMLRIAVLTAVDKVFMTVLLYFLIFSLLCQMICIVRRRGQPVTLILF